MSINPIRFARTSPERLPVSEIAAFVALGISTILSGSGVYFSLDVFALNFFFSLALAGSITFLITASIYICVRRAGYTRASSKFNGILHNRKGGFFGVVLTFGLLMMCVSSATSFSAMAYLRYEPTIQAEMDSRANQSVVEPLQDLAVTFGAIAIEASNVSALAAARSDLEASAGGTCGPTGAGEGPFARLRAGHAETLDDLNASALLVSRDASSLLGELSGVLTQSKIDAIHAKAQALVLSPDRQRIARTAESMRSGYSGTGFVWEGQTRFCDDEVMVAALDQLLTATSQSVALDPVAPTKLEATLFDAYAVFWAFLLGDESKSAKVTAMTSLPFFLGFALFLDAVGAFAAWKAGSASGRHLTAKERDELHKHRWILQNFVWKFPARKQDGDADAPLKEEAYLIVPHGGDGCKTDDAEKFAFAFGLHVDASRQFVSMAALPKAFRPFVDRLRLASGDATSISVYPIEDQATYDRLERHKRLCALALWSERARSNEYGDVDDKKWTRKLQEKAEHVQEPEGNLHSIFGQ